MSLTPPLAELRTTSVGAPAPSAAPVVPARFHRRGNFVGRVGWCGTRGGRIQDRRDGPGPFDEVLVERRFQQAGDRAAHPHLRVAPVIRVFRIAEPVVATPTPPVNATSPSTTRIFRCVRVVHLFELVHSVLL